MEQVTIKPSILYISYDGLMEPLGQSQVLNYLLGLSKEYDITVISFEKTPDWENAGRREEMVRRVNTAGLHWKPLRYHKRPPVVSTLMDVMIGLVVATRIVLANRVRVVHARSYVPALITLLLKKLLGVRFIFDMRGFWVDERVAAGLWREDSTLFRVTKWCERKFVEQADTIVSLTHAAIPEVRRIGANRLNLDIQVIPTCTNLDVFAPAEPDLELIRELDLDNRFVVGYVGSAGLWQLFDSVVECFWRLRSRVPTACLLIVNRGEHEYIRQVLARHGIAEQDFRLVTSEFSQVPRYIRLCRLGIFFNKPGLARLASAPTRLGEFLGCGVPVIGNAGVGDVAEVIDANKVGAVVSGFTSADFDRAIEEIIEDLKTPGLDVICRQTSERVFSLRTGIANYNAIYSRLMPR